MFERFSQDSTKSIILAQEEARQLGRDHVGSEHILMGLLRAGGKTKALLEHTGIELPAVRAEAERLTAPTHGGAAIEIPFTPRAKKVLENSSLAASAAGSRKIESEHLLLGLLKTTIVWRFKFCRHSAAHLVF